MDVVIIGEFAHQRLEEPLGRIEPVGGERLVDRGQPAGKPGGALGLGPLSGLGLLLGCSPPLG